jgi:antitoxin YefM
VAARPFWSPLALSFRRKVSAESDDLVVGVESREEGIVMTRKGKPLPVLVNHVEYERLKETVDVLSDPVLMRQIRASRRYFGKGRRGLSFEDVFGEPIAPARRRVR